MRTTGALIKVLGALLESGAEPVYGFDVMRSTGLKSGTVYALLDRLVDEGWATSEWEVVDPRVEGRPRRCFYRLTADGQNDARHLMFDLGIGRVAAWTI